MTRTGTVPTLLAGAGSARGRPQARMCCAPVPKKATSGGSRSGSSPTGQHAPAWLWPHSPSPALLCSATSTTHVCCHPTVGTPLSPVPRGPHNQPKGEHGITAPLCTSLPQEKAPGSPHPLTNSPESNQTPGLAREQLLHWEQAGNRVTPGLAGTDSAAGGSTRTAPRTGSYIGLVNAWILTWDWAATGFSFGVGLCMDSHLRLVNAWILTQDWPAHGF